MIIDLSTSAIPYLIPYTVSFFISLYIGLFAWHKKQVAGSRVFALLNFLQMTWILGYVFELISVDLQTKTFWDDFQVIPAVFIAPTSVIFAITYTNHPLRSARSFMTILITTPLVIIGMAITNPLHQWMRPATHLLNTYPFGTVDYDFGIGYWIFAVTSYMFIMLAAWIIIQFLRNTQAIYQFQGLLFVLGMVTPLVCSFVPLFTEFKIAGQRDISPFAFGIANFFIALAILRYKFFDLVPIARELVIENMQDMVIVVDAQHRLVDFNHATQVNIAELTTHMIGQPIRLVLNHWSDIIDQLEMLDELNTQITIPTKQTKRYFDLQLSPLTDKHQQTIGKLVILRDITQAKEAEAEIQQRTHELEIANARLHKLSRAKDQFVSNVSHELKTPITNLKLTYELMQLNPENSEIYIGRLQRETDRLALTIDDLLRLSRFDQGRAEFEMVEINLNELCAEYVEDRSPLAKRKHVQLTFEQGIEMPRVIADRGFIGQVLSILLTNAINYTPDQGDITVKTQIKEKQGTPYVGFSITDSGLGIPPDEHEKIFQRFYRGNSAGNAKVPGTGLGLAIAQEIIIHHGGYIEVKSQGIAGQGTTFCVWLPVKTQF